MAAAPLIMMAVGTAVSTVSAIKQGQAAGAAADAQASMQKQAASDARAQADAESNRARQAGKKHVSGMRAAYAASGVSLEGGSALDVLEESAAGAELDAISIKHQGYRNADNLDYEAGMSRSRAGSAREGGMWSGASNLLEGASRMYSYKKA